ncbi:MAG: M1 family metallopeptidase [Sphingomonas sp.]
MNRFVITAAAAAVTFSGGPALALGQLPSTVRPIVYDITVDPNATAKTFTGSEKISISVAKPTRTIVLNAADLKISSATLDGKKLSYKIDEKSQQMTLALPTIARAGVHTLAFKWSGKINPTASGLFFIDYKNVDGSDARMLVTQFEAPDARRFAPMFDEPSFKAKFRLSAVAPKGQTAFSNMPGTKTVFADGRQLYRFGETPIMSSYLLFLGMGDVERKTVMAGETEIGIITRRGVSDQGDYALASAKRLLAEYNDYFGQPYPLPKLDMIAGPGTSQFFGAMENWGAIFYFEQLVLFDKARATQSDRERIFKVVAHEMAHQWFGDLVTMGWWDDLWLNEGFASWRESKATNDLNPDWLEKASAVSGAREAAMGQDSTAATHPVIRHVETVDQIGEAFDGITYSKGEAVIRMLESTLGADVFREGIRRYMAKYKYQNTTTDQLWVELAAAAGKPVAEIARDFTLQGGVPLVSLRAARCVDGKTEVTLQQSRFGFDELSKKPQNWRVPMALGVLGAQETRTIVMPGKPHTALVQGCGTVVLNRDKGSYVRVKYDDASHAAIVRDFAKMPLTDRLGTLGDDYALGISGDQDLSRYFALLPALVDSASPLEWQAVSGDIAGLTGLYRGTPLEAPLRVRAVETLSPVLQRIGMAAQAGESPLVTNLRESLVGVLGTNGDPAMAALARGYVNALAKEGTPIPAAIRSVMLGIYATNATAPEWELVQKLSVSETDPVARNEYITLLGVARDEKLARRALDILKTDDIGAQQKAQLLGVIAGRHPDMAFDFAVSNLELVNGFIETSSRAGYVVRLGGRSNDPAMPGKIMAFAQKNLPEGSRGSATRTITQIQVRKTSADRVRAAVANWLGVAG